MKKLNVTSILAIALIATAAHAQWTVTVLHPPLSVESFAQGASGATQVGYASSSTYTRAVRWLGSAGSWVGLHPAGAYNSRARGVSGSIQVGEVDYHASLWQGTAASWVDLSPEGAYWSSALGASGSCQVGYAGIDDGYRVVDHAGRWSGSGASWVDLNPSGAEESRAVGASGSIQVGFARFAGYARAGLWTGTAESWVDLNPAWADASYAYAASGSSQVGSAVIGSYEHASLWYGTAASWIDLHPSSALNSAAYAVAGSIQVGHVDNHAALWTGSAASWVDLHTLLPAEFIYSLATAISSEGLTDRIAGYGLNSQTGRWQALLWTRSIVPPVLTARSANPSVGVPITVWTADRNGNKNGITSFERIYNPGTVAILTSPQQVGSQWFDRWELDGQTVTTNRTVSVTMSADHTAKAVYVTGRTLTVRSQNPSSGVPIMVYQADKQGLKNGSTQFTRIYGHGSTVSMTAPASAGGAIFVRWLKEGTAQPLGVKTISVSMNSNREVTAVYAP